MQKNTKFRLGIDDLSIPPGGQEYISMSLLQLL